MNADLRSNTPFGVAIAAAFRLARAEAIVDPIAESRDFLGREPSINFRPLSKPQPRRTNTSVIRG
jgi:hypothetical protein